MLQSLTKSTYKILSEEHEISVQVVIQIIKGALKIEFFKLRGVGSLEIINGGVDGYLSEVIILFLHIFDPALVLSLL